MLARFCSSIAVAVLLGACTAGDEAPRSNTAPTAPPVVTLTATDGAFQAPDTIVAGWTTFLVRNRGEELHYAHAVRLEPGRTVQELV